ncbi:MAG: DUF6029 family protein, partial [Fidelibacterota bacterium]
MRFLLVVLVVLSHFLPARTPYVSAGLTLQYGEGARPDNLIGSRESIPYFFREHFLEITAGYGPLSVWSNLEFSSPPQIGPDHLGLRKFRLSWMGENFTVRLGDLYGQVGRGLAINLWENQGIDWDSSLRGIWARFHPPGAWSMDLIRGTVRGGQHLAPGPGVDGRRRDFSDDATVTAASITGEKLLRRLSVGAYLVNVKARNPWFTRTKNPRTGEFESLDSTSVVTRSLIPGVFLEHRGSDHDVYAEIMGRRHDIRNADSLFSAVHGWMTYPSEQDGWGGYASFSLFPGRWGLTVEYKNYFLDDSSPVVRRNLPLRLGRMSPVQNPPTVFREHSSTLLSRTPHLMDFEDEVGIQLEANLRVSNSVFLVLNFSQSSRHTGFTKRIDENFSSRWEKDLTPSLLWMSSDERFHPFREWYGELDYRYLPLGLDLRAGLSRAEDVLVFDESLTEKPGTTAWLLNHEKINVSWENRRLISVPLEATFSLPSGWGVAIYWEHQWENLELRNYLAFRENRTGAVDSVTTDRRDSVPYYYRYVAVSVGRPSRFSVGWVYDAASRLKTGRVENTDPQDDNVLEALLRKAGVDLSNKWLG